MRFEHDSPPVGPTQSEYHADARHPKQHLCRPRSKLHLAEAADPLVDRAGLTRAKHELFDYPSAVEPRPSTDESRSSPDMRRAYGARRYPASINHCRHKARSCHESCSVATTSISRPDGTVLPCAERETVPDAVLGRPASDQVGAVGRGDVDLLSQGTRGGSPAARSHRARFRETKRAACRLTTRAYGRIVATGRACSPPRCVRTGTRPIRPAQHQLLGFVQRQTRRS